MAVCSSQVGGLGLLVGDGLGGGVLGDGERLDHAGQLAELGLDLGAPLAQGVHLAARGGQLLAGLGAPLVGLGAGVGGQLGGLGARLATQRVGLELGGGQVVGGPLAQRAGAVLGLGQAPVGPLVGGLLAGGGLLGEPGGLGPRGVQVGRRVGVRGGQGLLGLRLQLRQVGVVPAAALGELALRLGAEAGDLL